MRVIDIRDDGRVRAAAAGPTALAPRDPYHREISRHRPARGHDRNEGPTTLNQLGRTGHLAGEGRRGWKSC